MTNLQTSISANETVKSTSSQEDMAHALDFDIEDFVEIQRNDACLQSGDGGVGGGIG